MDENGNITKEELIKRYAHNRWELRQHFQWNLHEGPETDYRIAKELVEKEEKERIIRESQKLDNKRGLGDTTRNEENTSYY